MSRMTSIGCLFTLVCLLALVAGCSDDKTNQPATPESHAIQMVDVGALVEAVAPPEFIAPATSPSAIDTMWNQGEYSLLGKVFGSHEPGALYTNINNFKMSHEILVSVMLVDDNGDPIPGVYVDSHLVDMNGTPTMMHFTATATPIENLTAVPAIAQAVIGAEVDVDYLINIEVEEMVGGVIRMAMSLNDTAQTIFQWEEGTSGDDEQTQLTYASLDPRDSSFTFRGLGYCQHPVSEQWPNGDLFCWAYNITAEANTDFSYRMSAFSNGTPGMTFLHSFVGGGNKETEFAVKYRLFNPADTAVCDSMWSRDQVFGPNYTEGAGLLTDYDEYLADELLLPYSAVPHEMIPNPFAE